MSKIQFKWNGKTYAMTSAEIEAAYRHQLHAYRMQDAERHVNNLVFDEDELDPDSEYQKQAIDEFIASGTLPKRVDDFFVKAINALLKGFEPVVIDTDDLVAKLEQMPPMDEASFKAKVNELISAYTKGKDAGKLRIVVKRKESEG